ncbi:MAG TPA: addiction module antidote protein [Candidatus Babeliales bacterium]|jgi:probable addiction module antidote protein|nr:addiction module antidote protein [Candidatus Babeliales bacterium]
MTKNKRTHKDFQEFLLENLQDPQEAAAYLKAALADDDEGVFLLALRDVLEARGRTIAHLSEETHLNKQNLYRMLSKNGNPRLTSLKTVLHAIGFEMDIHPLEQTTAKIPKHLVLKK